MQGDNAQQVSWDTLIRHLSGRYIDLGWEALAALCEMERCNLLLFVQLRQTTNWAANTPEAIAKWDSARTAGTAQAEAERMGRRTTGGRWSDGDVIQTTHLLVPRVMNESWPFRILWHRSQIVHTMTVDAKGKRANRSDGGKGHYESLVAHIPLTPVDRDHDEWVGVIMPNTQLHEHIKAIGTRVMCTEYNGLARVRMERDYNKQLEVAHFGRMNAVGLRRASLSRKKGAYTGLDCLPCIIIYTKMRGESEAQRVPVKQFGLLSEYGVLEGWYTADQLVTVTLHNYPRLVHLYAQFTAGQLCAESSPDFEPIQESTYDQLSAEDAFKKQDQKRRPIAVDNSRRRDVTARASFVAAETSLINARLDKNKATSLNTLSDKPQLTQTGASLRPEIKEVLQHNREQTRFKVLWGAPTHDWQWLSRAHLMQWEEYRQVMEEYAVKAGIDLYAAE